MSRPSATLAALAGMVRPALSTLATVSALAAVACGPEPSAVYDSYPIALERAPMGGGFVGDGALLARATLTEAPGAFVEVVVDTGSATTVLNGPTVGELATFRGGLDIFDAEAVSPPAPQAAPLRASFRNIDLLRLPLQSVGEASIGPAAVLGGNLLRGFSVQMRFGAACTTAASKQCASMTLWNHLGADESFLEDAGYAVYRFSLFGGGEVTALGDPDFLGFRGPLVLPATRIALRTCAVPKPFVPTEDIKDIPACCRSLDAQTQATGVNLSLLLATGVGPVILSRSAFTRVMLAAAPVVLSPEVSLTGSLLVATWPVAIDASWTTIPRLAFVDLESGPATDPGACVELGRARRTEQVSFSRVRTPEADVCGQPCDADSREPTLAQSSAAYLELGGQIPVAIVADNEPFLQALRFDVRPEGPELDGLVGAGALGRARVEIDYLSSQPRALFSCEPDAPRDECWAAARCPRLPDQTSIHYCFALPAHGLPPTCAPNSCPAP